MGYTKEKRKEIYLMAADRLEGSVSEFACDALMNTMRLDYTQCFSSVIKKDLPEFYLFKPKIYYDSYVESWWEHGDKEPRINCLLLCAEMCND